MESQNEQISFLKQFKPGDIPADASYISDEELERLPDYVLDLIVAVENGELPSVTKEELQESIVKYFESAISISTGITGEEVEVETTNTSFSTSTSSTENDITTGNYSDSSRKVHSSEQ